MESRAKVKQILANILVIRDEEWAYLQWTLSHPNTHTNNLKTNFIISEHASLVYRSLYEKMMGKNWKKNTLQNKRKNPYSYCLTRPSFKDLRVNMKIWNFRGEHEINKISCVDVEKTCLFLWEYRRERMTQRSVIASLRVKVLSYTLGFERARLDLPTRTWPARARSQTWGVPGFGKGGPRLGQAEPHHGPGVCWTRAGPKSPAAIL